MTGRGASGRGWCIRTAFLLLALTLVLMHHLVGAHQHRGSAPETPGAATAHVAADTDTGSSGTAPLHVHQGGDGHGVADLLHACLAVLAAAALALVLGLAVRLLAATPAATSRAVAVPTDRAPPPGVPLRLAQLQVLRL
ncbi:DUF6153 family protein [Actinomycetospora sp. OC33-EN08]|uniref:DUF6153 family protein n=1 Tax=Actinomycetospora aurantiaca TaxID=3129233 RepID=A0ABU8MIR4_9PSEU